MSRFNGESPPRHGGAFDVCVIGGGAIGVCTALELSRRGASVIVLERGAELASGCSAGNAGIVGPGHVEPLANPAAIRDGLRWMMRPDSPFYVRPRPSVVPWLMRFVAAATPGRHRRARAALRELAIHSAALHAQLHDAGLDAGYVRQGLLNVFSSERAFAAARADAADARQAGLRAEPIPSDSLAEVTPHLSGSYAGGVLQPDEAHCDPSRFVTAVGTEAVSNGVVVRTGVEVLRINRRAGRVNDLWTTAGGVHAAEVVVAAGMWSRSLARQLDVRLPMEAGKGYHVDVASQAGDPELPIWLHEQRVVITPMDDRIRMAGTLELSGDDLGVNARRVQAIVKAVDGAVPAVAARPAIGVWRGLRPCTPDGLPIIGRAPGIDNAILATGHGMWGLQLAPITGRLVAELAAGEASAHNLAPLRADRAQPVRALC